MEANEQNLTAMANYLGQTMSPDREVRKGAEEFLRSVEGQQGYPILLLTLLNKENVDISIKIAASITFKNFIKRNWKVDEDVGDRVHASDRDTIKTHVVNLMLTSPAAIQKQLSNSIAIIGQHDFPDKWQTLIPEMVSKFQTGDFHVINGVLQTAFSIFEKYSYEMKSQKLWTEIKFVLDSFSQPFTVLLEETMALASKHAADKAALKIIFGSLVLIAKIFYFLNYQDLPEFFEDNMKVWMTHFHTLLSLNNDLLKTDDDDEPGLMEELRSQICDNIGLYAHKYEEEFQPYMQQFVTAVWNLLMNHGAEVKYDLLTSNAIQFLASVADRQQYKSLFEDPATLASICEKIIVPNIQLRESDVELFEDNAEEYIRRDLEGSDVDTRRRAACDLVKGLSRYFESQITSTFGAYVQTMLANYNSSNKQNWQSKDAALYLVTSLATKAKTEKHGITKTNALVDLGSFATENVVPELQIQNPAEVNTAPVLKASAIKYLMTFRSQLPPETVKASLPLIANFLKSDSVVVHTYAAAAVEKFLIMKVGGVGSTQALVTAQDLAPQAQTLLQSLFDVLSRPTSAENEYVMKCIMRSFSTLQAAVIPYLSTLLTALTQKLQLAAKNPTKPHYNHYLFESLSLSIRIVCKEQPSAVANFESVLFPVFQEILQGDVQEFVPYVFQILSLLLELHNDGGVPEPYMALFQFLLVPVLWERPANIKPLVRLLQAYVSRGPQQVVATNKIEALLGVFQKLIASKTNDHEGFYLLQTMIQSLPKEALANYMRSIFGLLFQRLTTSKTTKFVKSFLVFTSLFTIHLGGPALQETVDAIQAGIFGMVVKRLQEDVQKVSGSTERKICAVGITKLLCETPVMLANYSEQWPQLLTALVALFELPEDDNLPDDEHFIDIEDTPGYQTAYSQLVFAGKREDDPVKGVEDPAIYLAQSLSKLSQSCPGKISPIIVSQSPQVQQYINKYVLSAGVSIC